MAVGHAHRGLTPLLAMPDGPSRSLNCRLLSASTSWQTEFRWPDGTRVGEGGVYACGNFGNCTYYFS
jgi:hypothetical protein